MGTYVGEHTHMIQQWFRGKLPYKTQTASIIHYHGNTSKMRIFSFYMLEIRSSHYFVKDLLTFSDVPPFSFGTLSLGIASKISAENYCAGTHVHCFSMKKKCILLMPIEKRSPKHEVIQ